MKLTKESLANALALTTAVFWLVCSFFVSLLPGFSMMTANSWMHGMMFNGRWGLNPGNFLIGGITLTIAAWLFGWLLGWSLKYFEKK